MNNSESKKAFEKTSADFAQALQDAYKREFTFLLIGRTGVGKSSVINQLLRKEVAKVGDFKPETMIVKEYRLPISNVNFLIVDTPGLCDDLPEKGNDHEYIKKIKNHVKYIDCLLFVTPLHETRARVDEIYGIELITKAFGEEIWANSVIVFSFSDLVKPEKYEYTLNGRTEVIKELIQKNASSKIVAKIPSVAISNQSEINPDGKYWLGELYTTIVERVSDDGFIQYLISTESTYLQKEEIPKNSSPYKEQSPSNVNVIVNLTDDQKNRIIKTTDERGWVEKVIDGGIELFKNVGNAAISLWNTITSWGR